MSDPLRCGARGKRTGLPCPKRPIPGKRRCKWHGGMSPGGYRGQPLRSMMQGRTLKQALRRALGLPWYGGRPRKIKQVRTMAEEAKGAAESAELVLLGALPDVGLRPVGELTAPEALGRASLAGLRRLIEIIEQPLDMTDLKQQRLIGDMALGVNKMFLRAAEGEFRARHDDVLGKLLEALQAERERGAKKPVDG